MKKLSTFFTSNLFIVLLLLTIIGYQAYLHNRIEEVYKVARHAYSAAYNAESNAGEAVDKAQTIIDGLGY